MIQKIKNLGSIITLIVFFVMAIASSPKNMTYPDFNKWVPKDFDPNTCILLIEKHPIDDKQNKRMVKFLEEKYPYRYEVVGAGPIFDPSGKYADRTIYKYAVVWKLESNYSPSSKQWNYDLYGNFLDLNTKEKSKTTKRGMNYGQVGYMPFFNSIVRKFKVKE